MAPACTKYCSLNALTASKACWYSALPLGTSRASAANTPPVCLQLTLVLAPETAARATGCPFPLTEVTAPPHGTKHEKATGKPDGGLEVEALGAGKDQIADPTPGNEDSSEEAQRSGGAPPFPVLLIHCTWCGQAHLAGVFNCAMLSLFQAFSQSMKSSVTLGLMY
jgi:hypothetical protein